MSDILNRDYPAKKRGRKRKLSAEEGARQIMDLLQGDTPYPPPRTDRLCGRGG